MQLKEAQHTILSESFVVVPQALWAEAVEWTREQRKK